jgi:hypothetical protein
MTQRICVFGVRTLLKIRSILTGQFRGEDTGEIADIPSERYNCSDLTNEHINATG